MPSPWCSWRTSRRLIFKICRSILRFMLWCQSSISTYLCPKRMSIKMRWSSCSRVSLTCNKPSTRSWSTSCRLSSRSTKTRMRISSSAAYVPWNTITRRRKTTRWNSVSRGLIWMAMATSIRRSWLHFHWSLVISSTRSSSMMHLLIWIWTKMEPLTSKSFADGTSQVWSLTTVESDPCFRWVSVPQVCFRHSKSKTWQTCSRKIKHWRSIKLVSSSTLPVMIEKVMVTGAWAQTEDQLPWMRTTLRSSNTFLDHKLTRSTIGSTTTRWA